MRFLAGLPRGPPRPPRPLPGDAPISPEENSPDSIGSLYDAGLVGARGEDDPAWHGDVVDGLTAGIQVFAHQVRQHFAPDVILIEIADGPLKLGGAVARVGEDRELESIRRRRIVGRPAAALHARGHRLAESRPVRGPLHGSEAAVAIDPVEFERALFGHSDTDASEQGRVVRCRPLLVAESMSFGCAAFPNLARVR